MGQIDRNEISIKLATRDEIDEICQLNRDEYWNSTTGMTLTKLFVEGKWWIDTNLLTWHMKILSHLDGGILLAMYKGQIIGQLDYIHSTEYDEEYFSRLHIIWLLTNNKYRRIGIAEILLQHLQRKFPNKQIWVEPEDDRSLNLYKKHGKIHKRVSSFSIDVTSFRERNNLNTEFNKIKICEISDIDKLISEQQIYCFIGRYYAPSYDIKQLAMGYEVHQFIWGNTDIAKVLQISVGDFNVYVVITQYLRVYTNIRDWDVQTINKILKCILYITFAEGFEEIFLQIYHDEKLCNILKNLGCQIVEIQSPMFKLNRIQFVERHF